MKRLLQLFRSKSSLMKSTCLWLRRRELSRRCAQLSLQMQGQKELSVLNLTRATSLSVQFQQTVILKSCLFLEEERAWESLKIQYVQWVVQHVVLREWSLQKVMKLPQLFQFRKIQIWFWWQKKATENESVLIFILHMDVELEVSAYSEIQTVRAKLLVQ